ncbi:family 20 glycosylhydrolase [Bifidobacterium pullorum subsp. saeculare]|uniref:beta-N-acetylhexosaminidase n=1 Tax=Bifidobacterium pullorum TaxID=78448 RepID=UPI001959ED41|nr:glycoside hydrolase family 20 zincin-like fold domain-containing protein [Bifidobacterium pullorum]MBM6696733.1 family 20 glycosylhydrolase [Bifidobacterium pullorum subsp. saeculare]
MHCIAEDGRTVNLALLPEPRNVQVGRGGVTLPCCSAIGVNRDAAAADSVGVIARMLRDDLAAYAGLNWDVHMHDTRGCAIVLDLDAAMDDQAYHLDIGPSAGAAVSVHIVGGDAAGLRYGVMTLRQILRATGAALPSVHIDDAPAFPVRGYYLDVTRGRVPTVDGLKAWIEELASYKYNQLHLYVEHSFLFEGLEQAWRGADAFRAEDILELDDYCERFGIELVPSISTFGHQYMTLRTNAYRDLGEFPEQADRPFSFIERMEHHTFNPVDSRSLDLVTRMIDQYAPLFRSRKFNICADETFDLGRGRSSECAGLVGIGTLYADYLETLCSRLRDRGLEPMLWADIAVHYPDALSRLSGRGILLNWQYEPDVTEERTAQIEASGAVQYVCPAVHCWNSLLPRLDDAWANISRMARYGMDHHAVGLLVTDWGDFGHINAQAMSIPGMCYGAACGWNGIVDDRSSVDRAIDAVHYGTERPFCGDLAVAGKHSSFGWADAVRYVELAASREDCHCPDGDVNRDVAASSDYWAETAPSERIVDARNVGEARRLMLSAMVDRIVEGAHACAHLDDDTMALSVDMSSMRFGRRRTTADVMLAVEGTRLLNLTGLHLLDMYGIRPNATAKALKDTPAATEVAANLERWFEDYTLRWRDSSRESELWRIREIVWCLADELRRSERTHAIE